MIRRFLVHQLRDHYREEDMIDLGSGLPFQIIIWNPVTSCSMLLYIFPKLHVSPASHTQITVREKHDENTCLSKQIRIPESHARPSILSFFIIIFPEKERKIHSGASQQVSRDKKNVNLFPDF
jgi:hypothetical protein